MVLVVSIFNEYKIMGFFSWTEDRAGLGGKRLKVKLRAGKNAEWQAAQTPIICDVRSFIYFFLAGIFFCVRQCGSIIYA